jgi:hypothetical protein
MRVDGGLRNGHEVQLRFFSNDDVCATEYNIEPQPQSRVELTLAEEESRALVAWIGEKNASDYQRGAIRARRAGNGLLIAGIECAFAIHLATSDEVESLRRALSGALSLITGRAVDPSTLQ